jgi:hypothetical protein
LACSPAPIAPFADAGQPAMNQKLRNA